MRLGGGRSPTPRETGDGGPGTDKRDRGAKVLEDPERIWRVGGEGEETREAPRSWQIVPGKDPGKV